MSDQHCSDDHATNQTTVGSMRRAIPWIVASMLTLGVAGCSDDTQTPDPEPSEDSTTTSPVGS